MSPKWNEKFWDSFYWYDVNTELDRKVGSQPVLRIQITTSGATTDVTSYLRGGATLDSEKSRYPDEMAIVACGDVMLTFSNHNNLFTELNASSIFYGTTYLGKNIDIDFGLRLIDGTIEYYHQAILKIIDVQLNSSGSECSIVGRDILYSLIDFNLNVPISTLTPLKASGNTGNGYMSNVQTKPFVTVSENWTLTCTTAGGSGAGTFSVIGSTSGNIGTATSDTEFSNATTGGIKFTIYAGATDWTLNDSFTFSTRQYPEWTDTNPAKIIWSILTGYNYDTDTIETWYNATPGLDHTQSSANTDIDYSSFQSAVTNIGGGNLTGYINYNVNLSLALQDILLHFLGFIFTKGDGKLYFKTYSKPTWGTGEPELRTYADNKKITSLQYKKSIESVINSCTAEYKNSLIWAWSDDSETTGGVYTKSDSTSIATYGTKPFKIDTFWYSLSGGAIQWGIDRIISKYANPITDLNFITGVDALPSIIGDVVKVTDTKTGLNNTKMEIYRMSRDFSSKPIHITINCDNTDSDIEGKKWCFLGSSADEGDGISPQTADYDSANESDKKFCYLSTTGSSLEPLYYLW